MRKRGMYLLLTVLLMALLFAGCGMTGDAPTVPAPESAVDNTPALPPQTEPDDGAEDMPMPEFTGTALEKAAARIGWEQAKYAAYFTPENTLCFEGYQLTFNQYGYLFVRRNAQSFIEEYSGGTVYEEDGLAIRRFSTIGDYTPREISGWVLVERDGAVADAFPFDCTDLLMANWGEQDEDIPAGIEESYREWDPEEQLLREFFNKTDLKLFTDLADREVRWRYEIQPENVKEVLQRSEDGAWDICLAGGLGGGDAWTDNVVLRENANGLLRRIGAFYDSSSDYGFFRNGDIYVCEPERLRILTEGSNYMLEHEFKMKFGVRPDGTKRILHALHRDPLGRGYVILYSQHTQAEAEAEWSDPQADIVYYRLALCDAVGNIREEWNTGYVRAQAMYDYGRVDMSRDGDTMIIRTYGPKDTPADSFTFSLIDHTFAPLAEESAD